MTIPENHTVFQVHYVLHEPVYKMNSDVILYYHTRHYKRTLRAKTLWEALLDFRKNIQKRYGEIPAKLLEYDAVWSRPEILPENERWNLCSRHDIDTALAPF